MKIQLGFIVEDPEPLPSLMANIGDIPNKVGGKPIWLNPTNPTKQICSFCNFPLPLLLQIYAPEDYPANAFHRIIYVFCCKNGLCHSKGFGLQVLRYQMEKENDIYDLEGVLKNSIRIENNQLKSISIHKDIGFCEVCGMSATSTCGNCHQIRYCTKEHQTIHWKEHKPYCKSEDIPTKPSNLNILFPELEFVDEDEPDKKVKESMEMEYKVDDEDQQYLEEDETETDVDPEFLKFQKRITLAPDQILRYGRVNTENDKNEPPLVVSSLTIPTIDPCSHCQSPRTFEFQITPQLLTYLKLDHTSEYSLDWGTLLVYTCSMHCDAANGQYAQEVIINQAFSQAGLGDSIRKTLADRENNNEQSNSI
ncbi:programmed cell death protein [Globomyces sp. JEL0801]|nr:programmed cell death protein [Globomyces sp. JEL0801]